MNTASASQLSPHERRAYEANIWRFYVFKFLTNFQFWFPIWVLYLMRERGLSFTQVTALEAPFWIIILLAEVPTGAVADRWGRKLSMLLGGAINAGAIFFFGIAPDFWWVFASYMVWGISMALMSGSDSAFLYDSLVALGREGEYSKAIGRSRAWEMGAGMVGGLIGAPLAAATNLSLPIVVSAGITLVATLVALTFHEPRHRKAGPDAPYFQVLRQGLSHAARHPGLRSMMGLNAVLLGAGMAGFIFVQPFLAEHHVAVSQFGLLDIPIRIGSILGALLAYRWVARLGERRLLAATLLGIAGGLTVLGAIPSVVVFAMFPVVRFFSATAAPITSDYVNRHSPQHLRATMASIASMASSVVMAGIAPLMGFTADRASLEMSFLVGAATVLTLGGIAFTVWTLAIRTERKGARPLEAAVEVG